jgi:transcriptional regulator with XRE-family HTH domain
MSLTLTRGETLLLKRKRRRETQAQAAERYHVTAKLYGMWERGQREVPFRVMWAELKPHERCLIRRRRERITQAAMARQLGCSRWWLNRMEQGKAPADALVSYWE